MQESIQELMNEISQWSDSVFGYDPRTIPITYHLIKEVSELLQALKELELKTGEEGMHIPSYLSSDIDAGIKADESIRLQRAAMHEYADCFILLLDSASHFGLTEYAIKVLVKKKLEINKKRKWCKPDKHGVIEHIKEIS